MVSRVFSTEGPLDSVLQDYRMLNSQDIDRRGLLRFSTAVALSALAGCTRKEDDSPIPDDDLFSSKDLRPLAQFPGKDPLILLTDRPPQLETPLHYFRQDLTPNEAHFVRWHLSGIPTEVDPKTWRLSLGGAVKHPLSVSLDDLHNKFEAVSVIAVNQCSGNSRSLFEPRVPGGQWRHGAMSNAKWTGVRLKDLIDRAGLNPAGVEVSFAGLDKPPLAETPPFEKSLPIEQASNADILVAYGMNDKPLPMLNGFPVRLIVPGWYATYWVKALSRITVRDKPLQSFWMDKAYRIPNNKTASETAAHQETNTIPINKMGVHSFFVVPEPGDTVSAGKDVQVQGLATDGGAGIRRVEISFDGGRTWGDTNLDPELGRYSWRRWHATWPSPNKGKHRLLVRATNAAGITQVPEQWNHSGYQRNMIEHMDVRVV
jgi:DMSO/TMAO reductase YedYZ molybdopterin-dependent catalytic subunit